MGKERDQNRCKECSYTWYPRGKDLSEECPKCKSSNVAYAGGMSCSVLIVLLLVGLGIIGVSSGLFKAGNESDSAEDKKVEGLGAEKATSESESGAPPEPPEERAEKREDAKTAERAESLTEQRKWTAKSGKTLEATLLRLYLAEGKYIGVFAKPGGETFEYKIGNLSKADVDLVREIAGAR